MPIAQLRMEHTDARLGLYITRPTQELQQPKAELNMRQIPARMEAHTTNPMVILDQTEARADVGLKSIFRANVEYAQLGRQAIQERIAKYTQDGIALRSIEYGTGGIQLKRISKQAITKPMQPPQITFLPRFGSLVIEGIPGTLNIEWQLGGVKMYPVVYPKANHNYTPGKVEAYLEQKNSLRIWIEPQVETRL